MITRGASFPQVCLGLPEKKLFWDRQLRDGIRATRRSPGEVSRGLSVFGATQRNLEGLEGCPFMPTSILPGSPDPLYASRLLGDYLHPYNVMTPKDNNDEGINFRSWRSRGIPFRQLK